MPPCKWCVIYQSFLLCVCVCVCAFVCVHARACPSVSFISPEENVKSKTRVEHKYMKKKPKYQVWDHLRTYSFENTYFYIVGPTKIALRTNWALWCPIRYKM